MTLASCAELARALTWIAPDRIAIVPGLSCERDGVPDVMRGEEVQVFGAMDLLAIAQGDFVLPGTHSKWVRVGQGRVQSFATSMSGELYALLRQHSILARTMPAEDGPLDDEAFVRGVRHAQASGGLLRFGPPGRHDVHGRGPVHGQLRLHRRDQHLPRPGRPLLEHRRLH